MALIWDARQVDDFIKLFGSNLGTQHVLVVNLIARRKYNPALPKDRLMLDHKVLAQGDGVAKLQQWHPDAFPAGLCVYMNPNPVNVTTALTKTLYECQVDATRPVHKTMMANLARGSAGALIHFDVDTKEPAQVRQVVEVLTATGVAPLVQCIIETMNGYHIVYKNDKRAIDHAALHKFQQSTRHPKPNVNGDPVDDYWFSVCRGGLVAVPGTLQGGFRVTRLPNDLTKLVE